MRLKTVVVILILGLGGILFIGFLTTNMMQASPKLNRFFAIRQQIATDEGIDPKGIRLPLKSAGASSPFTFDLAVLRQRDSAYLEALAGRVFTLEDAARDREKGFDKTKTYFRRVQFLEPAQRPIQIEKRIWERRAAVHAAIAPDGDARRRIAGAAGRKPAELTCLLEEKTPLSAQVGIIVELPDEKERDAMLERAARVSAAALEVLSARIRYVRIIFKKEDGTTARSVIAPTGDFVKERRRVGEPSKIEWPRILRVEEPR